MAYTKRRRSSPKRHTKKRRSMGAVKKRKESIARLGGLVGGAVATGMINKYVTPMLAKSIGEHTPKVLAALEIAVGYFLPAYVKGELVAGIGDGMIAAGGLGLLKEFGVINGIPIIAGFKELNAVNGVNPTQSKVVDMSTSNSHGYRPSVSQVMNGIYNRAPFD